MIEIYGLHGTFNTPSVFDGLKAEFNLLQKLHKTQSYTFVTPDILEFDTSSPSQWAREFIKKMDLNSNPRYLLGYSLGGRLAQHLMKLNPNLFKECLLVSAWVGQIKESEKPQREIWENEWVYKMQDLSAEEFMHQWNDLPLFKGDQPLTIDQFDGDRMNRWSEAFLNLSPRQHKYSLKDLGPILNRFSLICGARDRKYEQHYSDLALQVKNYSVVPHSGHRVITSNTKFLAKTIHSIIGG